MAGQLCKLVNLILTFTIKLLIISIFLFYFFEFLNVYPILKCKSKAVSPSFFK